MKIEFSSQRREMLLFLTTNMAAVTSRANQQYFSYLFYRRIAQECTFSHGSNASHKPRKRYNKNKRAGATIEFRYGLRLRITP